MKKLFFTIALLFSCPIITNSQWQVVNVDNSGSRFCDVCVVNQNLIWTVKVDNTSNICKSTNGGLSWQVFNNLNEYLYYISAIDENKAWVSTLYGDVYVTTNGGQNWTKQNYSPKNFINFLKFFNANTGFLIADPVPLSNDTIGFFYTRNGGANWIRSSNTPVINYNNAVLTENCANALDTNFIWFCPQTAPATYKFYILKGGFESVWHSYSYSVPGRFRNAVFKDSLNGLAASNDQILITSNGGINWQPRNPESVWLVMDFMLVPGTEWVILNNTTIVRISKDFGLTWNNTSGFGQYDLYYSDSRDTNSIWVAYNNGNLLRYNSAIGIIKISNNIPQEFKLYQNYPNPFNPKTKIRFVLPKVVDFKITINDVLGREVYSIADHKEAGEYEFILDGANYPSGVYFYKLETGDFSMAKKMILMK